MRVSCGGLLLYLICILSTGRVRACLLGACVWRIRLNYLDSSGGSIGRYIFILIRISIVNLDSPVRTYIPVYLNRLTLPPFAA